jgi:IS1 family transposase
LASPPVSVNREATMANHLRYERKRSAIKALIEGNSIRSTERMVGIHRDTIMRLLVRVGDHCQQLLDTAIRNVDAASVQVDEIWCYVGKKQKRCTPEEKRAGELGDQYCFVGLDADSKLVVDHRIGKRDRVTALLFMSGLAAKLADGRVQLTSDGFEAYLEAIEASFGDDVDYAMLIKEYAAEYAGRGRYSPPRVSTTTKKIITGNPAVGDIGTSYVERQNLTMRMMMRRFTRLTNGFSKKLANLKAAVALHFAYYNFCRVHRSLKITPAMAAGLTSHVWEVDELLVGETT